MKVIKQLMLDMQQAHESNMDMFATREGQLNHVNMVQFYIIARLFTKSKPKIKLLHDLCTSLTLFICICETFFICWHKRLCNFIVIRCDCISRDGGGETVFCLQLVYSFQTQYATY